MLAKIRIPTKEYAFIEVEIDGDADEIVAKHDELLNLVAEDEGLNQLDWAQVRNTYIMHNKITDEQYHSLSKAQRFVINEVKKTFKHAKK